MKKTTTDPTALDRSLRTCSLPKTALLLAVLALPFSLAAGCATIITGTNQSVSLNSNPSGAKVAVLKNGVALREGVTPTTFLLSKGQDYVVTFEAEGYQKKSFMISRGTFQPWVIANICLGGIIGGVIDIVSGAFWELDPAHVEVTLDRVTPPMVDGSATEKVFAVMRAVTAEGEVMVELREPLVRQTATYSIH